MSKTEVAQLRAENARLRERLAKAERSLAVQGADGIANISASEASVERLWDIIEERLGLCPSFFRLAAETPAIAWRLWWQAEGAYLDSPMPSLFKERLFTYLSRFCSVPYCVTRHSAFLVGRGRPAGDPEAPVITPDDVFHLLTERPPSSHTLEEHLNVLAQTTPGVPWPAPQTRLERALFGCVTALFMNPVGNQRCLRELQRVLGVARFQWLMLFLAFVRTAHFWTEVHPELELEDDAEALLEEQRALARWIRNASSTVRTELRTLLQQEQAQVDAAKRQLRALEESRAALQESEQHLRNILDALFAFVGVLTPDGTLIEANRAPLNAAGLTFEDVYGKKFWNCYWWNYDDEVQARLRDACQRAAHGESVRYDVAIRVADEERMTIDFQLVPLRDDEGQITHLIPSAVDITERRKTKASLRQREAHFRRAVTEAPFPILLHAEDGQVLQVSRAFTEITGYRLEEVPTITAWTERAYETRQAMVLADIERLYDLDRRIDEGEYIIQTKEGEQRTWSFSSAPLGPDAEGRRLVISMAADVTERKRVEEEREALIEELERERHALRELNETLEERVEERTRKVRELASRLTMAERRERRRIARILHDDLQQLLYGIQMQMARHREDLQDAKDGGSLNPLTKADAWLDQAIETTRELSVNLSPPVLGSEGLGDMLDWLAMQMQELHGLQVAVSSQHAYGIRDEDMQVLLFQSARELLFNIVKHGETDRATVEVERDGDQLVIRVHDAGRGFDVEEALRRAEHGESYGLFSVRERLELFGGRMKIDSTPGSGTRITIRMPIES